MYTKNMSEERINEVNMMCGRENPIYEQISNFSVALYAIGYLKGKDILAVDNLDTTEVSEILKDDFVEVQKSDISEGYNLSESKEKYLVVVGDTVFPKHLAVIADMRGDKPFFSKLRNVGSGYDSLETLMNDLSDEKQLSQEDIHYFRKK